MEIEFEDKKLEKKCSDPDRHFGDKSKKIKLRMTQIISSPNLKILMSLPQVNYHTLTGDYDGYDSIDAGYPYRFIVQPIGNPEKPELIKKIKIIDRVDYH